MEDTREDKSLQEEFLDLVIANLKRVFDPEINLNVSNNEKRIYF